MSVQSFLAKEGIRYGILGSAVSLAIAAPLASGDYSPAAHTDATRIGWYFDRTGGAEAIVSNVMGTDRMRVGVLGAEVLTGVLTVPVGGVGAPSVSFAGDLNTGLYQVGADNLGVTTGGVLRLDVSTTAVTSTLPYVAPAGAAGTPSYTTVGDLNTGIYFRAADTLTLVTNGTLRLDMTATQLTMALPNAQTMPASSGLPAALYSGVTALHASLAASTEYVYFRFGSTGSPTQSFATGALTTNRFFVINNPTYDFTAASTLTNAATLAITGAPAAGANATITNAYALWVQSGNSQFDGTMVIASSSAAALSVGQNGATTPAFAVDASTASSVSGLIVKSFASGIGVTLTATGGVNEPIVLSSKGTGAVSIKAPGAGTISLQTSNSTVVGIGTSGQVSLTPFVHVTAAISAFLFTGAADITLTAGTEAINVNWDMAQTREHATGAIATQRDFLVQATTHSFVGASTITNAATLAITGAPAAGTNATITTPLALWVQAGLSQFDGNVRVPNGAVGSPGLNFATGTTTGLYFTGGGLSISSAGVRVCNLQSATAVFDSGITITKVGFLSGGAATALTVSQTAYSQRTAALEGNSFAMTTATQQWLAGTVATQRSALFEAPTLTGFTATATFTNAATVAITGAPVAGTNATITNAYALWVQAGASRFDGAVNAIGGATAWNGALTTGDGVSAQDALLNMNVAGGWNRQIIGQTAAVARWIMDMGDSTAESGANAGSNFSLRARDDAGAGIDTVLAVPRVAGGAATFGRVVVGPTPAAGASGYASFRAPHGAAPTDNLTNGDIWTTTAGLFARINGATVAYGSSAPAGSDTQVQFNDAGVLGGDAGLTYNKTSDTLTAGGLVVASDLGVASAIFRSVAAGLSLQGVAGSSYDFWVGTPAGATAWSMATGTTNLRVEGVVNAIGGATAWNGALTTGDGVSAQGATLVMNVATGWNRQIIGRTASVSRWIMNMGDSIAESGANAGSNFSLLARDDAGAGIDTVLSVPRVAGGAATFGRVVVGPTPAAGASGYASFRAPHGAAPTDNLTNGDIWTTTAGLFARINGATVAYGSSAPAGSDTQVQFNDAGVLGGDAGLTYNKTTDVLSVVAAVRLGAGSAAAPAFSFTSDSSTGIYLSGGFPAISTSGTLRWTFRSTDILNTLPIVSADGSVGAPTYTFTSATNSGMYFATSQVAISAGGGQAARFGIIGGTVLGGALNATAVATTGTPVSALGINVAAHTALTASTEYSSVLFTAATQEFATGALTTQRFFVINAPTFGFIGASTITNAATLAIAGAPVAGANAVITNNYALWVQSGLAQFSGGLGIGDATNVVLATGTGTKFGTATTQKLAFYNATPIVQGASVADASGGAVIDAEARTAINDLISRIEATGLIATV